MNNSPLLRTIVTVAIALAISTASTAFILKLITKLPSGTSCMCPFQSYTNSTEYLWTPVKSIKSKRTP